VALLALILATVALIVDGTGGAHGHRAAKHSSGSAPGATATTSPGTSSTVTPPPRRSSYPVGLRVLRLVDPSRTIQLPNGASEPRTLVTYVRYPAMGPAGGTDLQNAPAAAGEGPFPLVVFGHGYAVTPGLYARLQQAWARAGYVVAAPAFPLENANAPNGPNESDLPNQPGDMRFVITSLIEAGGAGSSGPLAGLVDPAHVAVSGQSDGGDTALALAYDSRFRDSRVGAAIILSGAEIPAEGSFIFPSPGPPLLATQGTADTINPPSMTEAFFEAAQRPKYLLRLLGAEHLPPYTYQQPQLGIVERVTIAFLDGYLKGHSDALAKLGSLSNVPGISTLLAEP
jgi:dienelactone hydrolase